MSTKVKVQVPNVLWMLNQIIMYEKYDNDG